jgi:hypothetical protein
MGAPVLSGLACVPAGTAGSFNAAIGLPGLLRATIPVDASYF